jgi:hypothetical protein
VTAADFRNFGILINMNTWPAAKFVMESRAHPVIVRSQKQNVPFGNLRVPSRFE